MEVSLSGGNDHVLACLLCLNDPRVSEACGADLDALAVANGHRTLWIVGNGGQPALIPTTIASAGVDRFMHHAHVVVTEGDSYRFAEARNGKGVTPLT